MLGKAGFATVLIGLALVISGSVGEFWVFTAQPYGEPNGRDASWIIYLLGHLGLAVDCVLFGVATVRAKVLPRKMAMMFTVLGGFAVAPFFGVFDIRYPLHADRVHALVGEETTVPRPARVR